MSSLITADFVKAALQLPDFDALAAQRQMAPTTRLFYRADKPGSPKLAAVLILLYPVADDGNLAFALMRRTEYPGVHSGQISLPGGSCESGETWVQTALRETCEELGACDSIEVLGALLKVYVAPSDFEIHPIIGLVTERPNWHPNPAEVDEIIEVLVSDLLDHSSKSTDERHLISGEVSHVPCYRIGDSKQHTVWGGTAVILSEFEHRLRAVIS